MKKTDRIKNLIFFLAIILMITAVDQLTKSLATDYLKSAPSYKIVDGVFELSYLENDGAAWGMLDNAPWVFKTVSTVTIIAITLYVALSREISQLTVTALAFIAGGGVGNMIDRIISGYVVDFFNFCLIDFPVFNVADIFVTIGAGLLIIDLLFFDLAKEKQGTEK